ncbi:MAG: hypothetical protein KKD83_04805 [Chloroflexi bacterium]|nr:hypothetical protein [Chloroflexota bacterium]
MTADYPSEEKLSRNENDLPPEFCHYRDEGCDLAASCLSCPYPQCVYEQPGGRQRWLKMMRNREIVRQFTREGKAIRELALMFGISTRTVQRALGKTLIKGERSENE